MSYAQYFQSFEALTSKACTIDPTPPTFAGIISTTPQSDGTFIVTWAAATSTKIPVRYEIYVAVGSVSAAALFITANRVAFAPGSLTSWRIGWLRDQTTYIVNGQIYTFGIRAVDAQNYSDSNNVILTSTAIASGNIGGLFQSLEILFAADIVSLANQISLLTTQVTNITTTAASLAASATSLVSSAASIASSATSLASSASSLASTAISIATTEAALAITAAAISVTEAALAADVTELNAAIAALNAAIATLQLAARPITAGTLQGSVLITGTVPSNETLSGSATGNPVVTAIIQEEC